MQTIHIDSLDELPHAAAAVINALEGRSVVVFRGEMGAGKTTLIREIVARLGADDTVTSPTFAIVNQYTTREGKNIYHFDFYRTRLQQRVCDPARLERPTAETNIGRSKFPHPAT